MAEVSDAKPAPKARAAQKRQPKKYIRDAPAFQLYAADDLAAAWYYMMRLDERGLFDAMRRAVWCDGSVPTNAAELAISVRRTEEEVRRALESGAVMARFQRHPMRAGHVHCEELAGQRAAHEARREKQVEGGREGARRSKAAASTKELSSADPKPDPLPPTPTFAAGVANGCTPRIAALRVVVPGGKLGMTDDELLASGMTPEDVRTVRTYEAGD